MHVRARLPVALAIAAAAAFSGEERARGDPFQMSYAAGFADSAGQFAGGTEMRLLTAHGGKLYAGNGYWEDRPGPEGLQGAQILVLDGPTTRWRVDHQFGERMPNGRPRDLAVSALFEARFTTDGSGAALPRPVSLLIASSWDLAGAARVFTRDDATGAISGIRWCRSEQSRHRLSPMMRQSISAGTMPIRRPRTTRRGSRGRASPPRSAHHPDREP